MRLARIAQPSKIKILPMNLLSLLQKLSSNIYILHYYMVFTAIVCFCHYSIILFGALQSYMYLYVKYVVKINGDNYNCMRRTMFPCTPLSSFLSRRFGATRKTCRCIVSTTATLDCGYLKLYIAKIVYCDRFNIPKSLEWKGSIW